MFARMPRYTPAAPGIRSAAQMRPTGQNGSSRHVLALFDSSSSRINELSSGLLICGHIGPVTGFPGDLDDHYLRLGPGRQVANDAYGAPLIPYSDPHQPTALSARRLVAS
jgi:hypothetical protein